MFILVFLLAIAQANTNDNNSSVSPMATACMAHKGPIPPDLTLRVGLFQNPPVSFVSKENEGIQFRGFYVELLESLQVFATADNVTLQFELKEVTSSYNDAFSMVANDCKEVFSASLGEREGDYWDEDDDKCNRYDVIAGSFYATADRALRAHLTPSILKDSVNTVKFLGTDEHQSPSITTMKEASRANAPVCVRGGTYFAQVVQGKFPDLNYYWCDSNLACVADLKQGKCVLNVAGELGLRYLAAWDDALEVTGEALSTTFIVWPTRDTLPPMVLRAMDRWILAALNNGTMDALYSKYFQKALCPVGTAGEQCELPCDPNHGQADGRGICVCESSKWTGDDCSVELEEDTNMVPLAFKVIALCMVAINGLVILLCAVWLCVYRNSPQVRYAQPFFLLLVLLGCAISSSTILALLQEDSPGGDKPSCMSIPWLYSVGFAITFGTLCAKVLRVYMVFATGSRRTNNQRRAHFVSFHATLLVIGGVLLVDVAILVSWTLIDPLVWVRTVTVADQFGQPLASHGYCTSDSWKLFACLIGVFHLGLMAVACYLSYIARGIPSRFNQSKYVAIAMVSNLQIFVVGVPVLVILGTETQTSFFVRSCIVWMNDLMVVSLIFGNLMYSVYYSSPENDGTDAVQMDIRRAVGKLAGSSVQQMAPGSSVQSVQQMFSQRPINIESASTGTVEISSRTRALDAYQAMYGSKNLPDVSSLTMQSSFTALDGKGETTAVPLVLPALPEDGTGDWSLRCIPMPAAFRNSANSKTGLVKPERQDTLVEDMEDTEDKKQPECGRRVSMDSKTGLIKPERKEADVEDIKPEHGRRAPIDSCLVKPERKVTATSDTEDPECGQSKASVQIEATPKAPVELSSVLQF
ncbi:acid type B receptor subunit 2 [Seminavis robusta]|uniref:Acid type B receptor subunit 2 n=1 Tax=Seminavis robusta TaxID=568900 RepID=A0A9N8H9D4_9STRA|nr:acid type B receptor subunit 2 [Seminavis robusta]|eukprot:Sro251_g099130.1 acid type B receptor subunit 2 (868) ;mRNA; f:5724-8496